MTPEHAGRVAFVTGAAGDGAGRAIAERLLADGATVALTDSHGPRTERVAKELAATHGERVAGYELDVGDRAGIADVVARVEAELGPIDILVNNAAVNDLVPVSRFEEAAWDRVMEVDLNGCFLLIRHVLAGMMARGFGAIVNVTSVAAWIGNDREGPYAAAKAALHSLTRSVAVEGGPHGVRCNAVAPGIIRSKFVTKYEDRFRAEVERTPARRLGEPGDVANAVAFLVSEQSSFVTGEVLNVSGGWYMRP